MASDINTNLSVKVLESFVSVGVSLTIYELEKGKDVKRIQVDTGAEIVLKEPFGWVELYRNTVGTTGAKKGNGRRNNQARNHQSPNGQNGRSLVEELRRWRENEFSKIRDQRGNGGLLPDVELLFITEPQQFVGLVFREEFLVFDDMLQYNHLKIYCTSLVFEVRILFLVVKFPMRMLF